MKLYKHQQLQNMKRRNDESGEIEEREWSALLRGEDHWSNHWATQASIESITADVMEALVRGLRADKGFEVDVSHVAFHGRCRSCIESGRTGRH